MVNIRFQACIYRWNAETRHETAADGTARLSPWFVPAWMTTEPSDKPLEEGREATNCNMLFR